MDFLFPLLILALLVPMFLGIRRQKKETAKTTALQDSISVGDRILTTAGLFGTIVGLAEDTVELEIAPGVVTTWSRLVVRERIADTDDEHESIEDESVEDETGADAAFGNPEQGDNTPRLNKD